MRQTLYFALPDIPSAEQTVRDLLLADIEIPRIHCVARRGSTLGQVPETNILQKADVMPVAGIGFAFGGMLGGTIGGLLILFPPAGSHLYLWTMPFAAAIGAALGACVSIMAGILAPNSLIAEFERSVARGNILLVGVCRICEVLKSWASYSCGIREPCFPGRNRNRWSPV